MKRILIFSLAYYPNNVSGAEAAIKEITDRINDVEFHMVTLRYNNQLPKTEKIGNVLIHRIGLTSKNPNPQDLAKLPLDLNKPLYQFLAPLKAVALNRQYKYDAIWSMMAHSAGVPAVIYKILSPKTKFALSLQEGDPTDYIERKMRPLSFLFAGAFKKANVVQAISKHLANWAKSHGTKDANIELIHNGANPRDIKNDIDANQLEVLKQKLSKKESDIFLVNTARLVHQKANNNTIQALTKLSDNIKLLLVGDGPEKNMLKELAKKLNVENRVIFVGQVDRTEVSSYRQISDIFVCPSRSEGLGNAFLSAMASRLPVVATQEGGLSEFIFKDKTAWVVDKDSPEQIVEAIKDILSEPAKVKIITENARQMVVKKYNWDLVAKDMREKVFAKVL